jgi:chromosome segregation ATPase
MPLGLLSAFGIVSLLVHVNEAAVVSQKRRGPPRKASPALAEAFTEVSFTADANAANASDPDFPGLDKAAREDFGRRCEVLVTVSDEKFLPVKPLVRFCDTTDAPMECRLKVSMRLKETHARDGDMGQFCSAVYDWFQGKYGMKCPKQCKKLQCRSTCLWLDKKKEAMEENLEIKEEMQEAQEKMKYMKELADNITKMEAEEKKSNFTLSMSATRVARAEKALADREADAKAAHEKLEKVEKTVEEIETNITILKDNLVTMEDSIVKQTFALDKAKLKLEDMSRAKDRLVAKTEEQEVEEKSLQKDIAKIDKQLKELQRGKDGYSKQVTEATKEAAEMKTELDTKVDKLKTAEQTLDPFRKKTFSAPTGSDWDEAAEEWIHGDYVDDERVPETKELVENQYKRAKDAEQALNDQNQKIKDLQETIADIDRQSAQYGEEKTKVSSEETKANETAKQLIDEAQKEEEAMKEQKENEIDKPLEALEKAKAEKLKTESDLEKATRTLKFAQGLLEQQKSHHHALSGYVSQAQMSLEHENLSLKTSQGHLANIQEELKVLTDEEEAKKAAMQSMESGMMTRIKAYKERAKSLYLKRPEIVRLFGLEPKM